MQFVQARYPHASISCLAHRELRESGWRGQLRTLSKLRGTAVVFYFRTLDDVREPEIFIALHLLHGCRESVLADEAGNTRIITLKECLCRLPAILVAGIADLAVFAGTWVIFKRLRKRVSPQPLCDASATAEIAYIYPYPLNRDFSGGATTHMCGFLEGVKDNRGSCLVLSGCKFPFELAFPLLEIPVRRRRFIFFESLLLSYNWRFAREAQKLLRGRKPCAVYQRHGKFVIAGVLLARALKVPFVLEYNASEVWMATNWDPVRFLPWIRLAEEVTLAGASAIATVSEVLKQELIEKGLPAERIFVNPNGVDPSKFRPDCGDREKLRRKFGFEPQHVVATFAGTFGYWHGVEVLQAAVRELFEGNSGGGTPNEIGGNLRFLLIGKGLLQAEMRAALRVYEERGLVVFLGVIPHEEMPSYLDLADILLSPHVPLPDGRPFFGSPTKLFEYMAMGKAIVASRLDQIEAVLEDNRTAVLVQPGNVEELAQAILAVAANSELRNRLGRNAREAALAKHTWRMNAANVMAAAGIEHAGAESFSPR
jgi:glycosyltransferase involved in cell wall biosynthesis